MPGPGSQEGVRESLAAVAAACPGATLVLLVDGQGIVVERHRALSAAAPDELAVEVRGALPALGRVGSAARIGRTVEWIMVAERGTLVVRRIATLELFLVAVVGADEFLGRARTALRVAAGRLAERLA